MGVPVPFVLIWYIWVWSFNRKTIAVWALFCLFLFWLVHICVYTFSSERVFGGSINRDLEGLDQGSVDPLQILKCQRGDGSMRDILTWFSYAKLLWSFRDSLPVWLYENNPPPWIRDWALFMTVRVPELNGFLWKKISRPTQHMAKNICDPLGFVR